MQTQAKLEELTGVNKERALALSPGIVESLALQGSQTSLCFQKLKKNAWLWCSQQLFLQYMSFYVN